jgi:hypothetical protein
VGSRRDGVDSKPRQGRHNIGARAVVILSPLTGLKKDLCIFLTARLTPWATLCRPLCGLGGERRAYLNAYAPQP